jgi:hypothetical protein
MSLARAHRTVAIVIAVAVLALAPRLAAAQIWKPKANAGKKAPPGAKKNAKPKAKPRAEAKSAARKTRKASPARIDRSKKRATVAKKKKARAPRKDRGDDDVLIVEEDFPDED